MSPDEMKAAAEARAVERLPETVSAYHGRRLTYKLGFEDGSQWMLEHLAKGGDGHPPRIAVWIDPKLNQPAKAQDQDRHKDLGHVDHTYLSMREHNSILLALESRIAELEGHLKDARWQATEWRREADTLTARCERLADCLRWYADQPIGRNARECLAERAAEKGKV